MRLRETAEDAHDASAQVIVSDGHHDARCRAYDLPSARSKDVDALVIASTRTRCAPGVPELRAPDAANGNGQRRRRFAADQLHCYERKATPAIPRQRLRIDREDNAGRGA